MFETSSDILNMSLAIGFAILVVFLVILIFYAIVVLRDVAKITDDVRQVTRKVKSSIVEPLRALDYVVEKAKPYIEMLLDRRTKEKGKAKK